MKKHTGNDRGMKWSAVIMCAVSSILLIVTQFNTVSVKCSFLKKPKIH